MRKILILILLLLPVLAFSQVKIDSIPKLTEVDTTTRFPTIHGPNGAKQWKYFTGKEVRTFSAADIINRAYVPDTTGSHVVEDDYGNFIRSTADNNNIYYCDYNGMCRIVTTGGGTESILNIENTSTPATLGTTNNYHEGKLGLGNFSGSGVITPLHIYSTSLAALRLSDSAAVDSQTIAYLEFYRGHSTNQIGRIGYPVNTDKHLYFSNNIAGGSLLFQTNNTTKAELTAAGQLKLTEYGDGTFTGTPSKYLAVDDSGKFIEVDGSSGGGGYALTSVTADGTDTLDLQTRSSGYFQIDLSGVSSTTLVFENPATSVVPTYNFHFQGVSNDTVTFPTTFKDYIGNNLEGRILSQAGLIECYYDGSSYYCSDTLGVSTGIFSNPSSISGMLAWYDASQESYSNGANVTTWSNQVSGSFDLTTGAGGNPPTFATNQLNSEPVIQFDADNEFLETGTIIADSSARTIYMVVKLDGAETLEAGLLNLSAGNNGTGGSYGITPAIKVGVDGGNITWNDSLSVLGYKILIVKNAEGENSDEIDGILDGTTMGISSSASQQMVTENLGVAVGSNGPNGATGFTGWVPFSVAEIGIYNKELSASEVSSLVSYLQTKYGL